MKKNSKKRTVPKSEPTPISKNQKRIFIITTFILFIIIMGVFEFALRLGNYGGNLKLFIPSTEGYEDYLRCNPNVARRYFFMQNTVPTPSKDLFLAQKPKNVFRIFVMGGSTAAGFPYGNNMMFSRILQRQLESVYPSKKFEVVNVATSAINSYTLLDFIDEILEQDPDLILIYAGHNEYYGALGVGSVESIGNVPWLIKSYLSLQKFKSFILLRDIIVHIKSWFGNDATVNPEKNPSATLMARIVSEQNIPLNSDLYNAGKEQFQSNLNDILRKTKKSNVPVIVSELVCNIRDQLPFISIESGKNPSANSKFREGRLLENAGKYEVAKIAYYQAKDLDALRFRAPEDFNEILTTLAKKYNYPVVPLKNYFEKYSIHGLIGNKLIFEHLHPNEYGYYLLATAFLNTIIENRFIDNQKHVSAEPNFQSFINSWGFTQLDKDFADLTIKNLKGGWPFKSKKQPNKVLANFKPSTISEQIALKILTDPNFGIEMGHLELAKYYREQKIYIKAYQEYKALIYMIPYELEFYEKAATMLITIKEYNIAEAVLQQSLKYKESYFAIKWLGQIALLNNNFNTAVKYLEKGRNMKSNDTQLLFNLGRAYYSSGNIYSGDEVLETLKKLEPESAYTKNLLMMKAQLKQLQ